uniref:Sulfhydryl oxidase n=1 Tax=Strigamia maritima TaxID=126957 RepID=T1JMP1_STRMM
MKLARTGERLGERCLLSITHAVKHKHLKQAPEMTRVVLYFPLLILISIGSISASLYNSSDAVIQLNATNFKSTVSNKTNVWIVEFYNTWCGHCVKFAPIWKEFAQDVKSWRNVISVAAIDCVEEINIPVCREYNIQSFPTIRFYKPLSAAGDFGSSGILNGNADVVTIRQAAIDYLDEILWPDFSFTKFFNFALLKDSILPSINDVVVIIENEHSYLGKEIIVDFYDYSNTIKVIRISDTNDIKSDFKPTKLPFVGLFTRDLKPRRVFDYLPLNHTSVVKAIKNILHLNPITTEMTEGSWAATDLTTSVGFAPDQVFMIDLEHAIHYTFFNELARHSIINGTKFQRLRAFVQVLARYFPGRLPVRNYLTKLSLWMERSTDFVHEEFEQFNNETQSINVYLPQTPDWATCRGSRQGLRGYPCSLWLLFHSLTVSAYMSHTVSDDFNPAHVPEVIANYVKYFFSCAECSKHFSTLSIRLQTDIREPKDTVLWFWSTHNKVNARLHGDITQDPVHPKIQFPPQRLCAACRLPSGQWNESKVLHFLIKWYTDINTTGVENTPFQSHQSMRLLDFKLVDEPVAIRVNERSSTWSFSTLDMSLCLTLYICSALILITVYFVIIVKRRMKRKRQKYFLPFV